MVYIQKEIKRVTIRPNGTEKQIRPVVTPPEYLCFTANTANSTVQLIKIGSPTAVNLEISTNGITWTDHTIGDTITLANIGDKVYMRNKSGTDTGFSTSASDYYQFSMTGSISASGDITTLLNKNGTNILSSYCYNTMFLNCTSLTTPPELPVTTLSERCYDNMFRGCTNLTTIPNLPATTLTPYCYRNMFYGCTSLTTIPNLPATTLTNACYYRMFYSCTNIKLATAQTGEYQTPYRIPTTGTGTTATNALYQMFYYTGGAFAGTPSINTTYYTSNTLV